MKHLVSNFTPAVEADDEGVTMIEYGILAAGISIAAVAVIAAIGPKLVTTFTAVSNAL